MDASQALWETMGYAPGNHEAHFYRWRTDRDFDERSPQLNDGPFAAQWRTIRALTRVLRLLPGVRFAAVCSRVSWQGAPMSSDIDWFIVTEERAVWAIHAVLAAMGKLLQRRPGERRGERASWCFSYIIDDASLDLSSLRIEGEDPCLSLWFSQFLVMVDDGIGANLWQKNTSWLLRDLPYTPRWQTWYTRKRSFALTRRVLQRVSAIVFKLVHRRWERKKRLDEPTAVVITPYVAKLQPGDRRRRIRDQYETLCRTHAIDPYPS